MIERLDMLAGEIRDLWRVVVTQIMITLGAACAGGEWAWSMPGHARGGCAADWSG